MTMAFKYLLVSTLLIVAHNVPALGQSPSAPTTPAPKPDVTTPSPDDEMPKMKCVTAGFMCSDCNNQAVCIGNGDGTFVQIENHCPADSHCVQDQCMPGAKCNYRKFKCTDEGFFPDPFDCTKYHVCMYDAPTDKYKGLSMNCGDGRGSYDATSGSCGFPMNSTACMEGPVPRCVAPLQIGMLKSDPSIYYLCTDDENSTGPELYKCSGGKIFDTKKVSCVPAKKSKKKI